jgi:tRNA dimethylallyltransferase
MLVICGPTASGKTRLAVQLAARLNGEIISADSRQVYRGMDIGTGKEIAEYRTPHGAIPYHLIDIAEPSEIYTLHHFQRDFAAAFRGITSRGRLSILAGGTGLYIEAVLRGYQIPEVAEDPKLRARLAAEEKAALVEQLRNLSPELLARTDTSSKKRVIRAIEVAQHQEPAAQQSDRRAHLELRPLVLGIAWSREELCRRIDERLEYRLRHGMAEEVKRLLCSALDPRRYALFGMEYKHVAQYIKGALPYEAMVDALRRDIYRLAKRQRSYFRGMERRGVPIHWIAEANVDAAMEIVGRHFDV